LGTFIEKNKRVLEMFISAARSHTRVGLANAADVLDATLSGRDEPFGQRNCYRVSDTVIVMEAPADAEIYSTDGDIHEICRIMGRSRYSETVPTRS